MWTDGCWAGLDSVHGPAGLLKVVKTMKKLFKMKNCLANFTRTCANVLTPCFALHGDLRGHFGRDWSFLIMKMSQVEKTIQLGRAWNLSVDWSFLMKRWRKSYLGELET